MLMGGMMVVCSQSHVDDDGDLAAGEPWRLGTRLRAGAWPGEAGCRWLSLGAPASRRRSRRRIGSAGLLPGWAPGDGGQ